MMGVSSEAKLVEAPLSAKTDGCGGGRYLGRVIGYIRKGFFSVLVSCVLATSQRPTSVLSLVLPFMVLARVAVG